MAEAEVLKFEYKEVVTALIKQAGVQKGIWGIFVEFGIAAANVADSTNVALPTALVPIMKIGLRQVTSIDNLSVDAAEVNPSIGNVSKPPRLARVRKTRKAPA